MDLLKNRVTMSDTPDTNAPPKDAKPEEVYVQLGDKKVPFSKINKPHTVVLNPGQHKPQVDPSTFPDIEPAAKEREAELEAEREKKNE